MIRRPLLATTAAAAVLALIAASGSASAASTTSAAGRATTSVTVLDLSVAGHELSLVDLALSSDTIASPRVSSIALTPVTVDGTGYGRQTVNQSTSPKTVGALSTPSAVGPFAALTSPAVELTATSTPSNRAGAESLGTVKVLGLPVKLVGELTTSTSVTATAGAAGVTTIRIDDLALPSIADLLGALGLDLSALPLDTLDELINSLELITSALVAAENAVDDAQAAVDAATTDLATKTADLAAAEGALTAAEAAFATATTTVDALLATAGIADVATYEALSQLLKDAAELLAPGLAAAVTDYLAAEAAVAAATGVVATAQLALDTAQALLASLTSTLTSAIATLRTLLTARLDATPLVSLDSLEVSTKASATSASKGGQHATVVGGTVKGLEVLGVDVLAEVTGSRTLDLAGVASSTIAAVNSLMAEVTGTLSDVLSNVPGFPVLDVPAPKVGLLTKSTSTSISGGFGRASASISGLTITIPGITLPTSLALPGAAGLPAMTSVTQVAGQLTSAPITARVLTLRDQAAFRPGVIGSGTSAGGPSGSTGGIPNTGLPVGVAALSLLLLGGALAVRRQLAMVG